MDIPGLTSAAEEIRTADSVVAMTGAGISTASGIPDFRSENGIWQRYDPSDFHITRFRADPAEFWRKRLALLEEFFDGDIVPNVAHEALAELEAAGHLDTLITQNIDGLHQTAGSEDPIEIHGNGRRVICTGCGRYSDIDSIVDRFTTDTADTKNGIDEHLKEELPPTCDRCEDVFKPDVVLFGEQLPEYELHRARSAARCADVFLAVGTSLTVEPAASMPRLTVDNGGTLLVINLDSTPLSDTAEYDFRRDVTEIVPRLLDRVRSIE